MSDKIDQEVLQALTRWAPDPGLMVREAFGLEPDAWQDRALRLYCVFPRVAVQGSRGVGSSFLLACIAWHFLLTRLNPKAAVTSITQHTLRDNFWVEMRRLYDRSALLPTLFEFKEGRVELRQEPDAWCLSSRSWPKTSQRGQVETFAGMFAENVLVLIDDAGGVAPSVLDGALGSMLGAEFGRIVIAGSPISADSLLHRAVNEQAADWSVIKVNGTPGDPLRSSRVSEAWASEQIRVYGAAHPWVQVNVFGEFPT